MSLSYFALTLAAAYVLVAVIQLLLQFRIRRDPSVGSIPFAAALAACGLARGCLLVATASTAAIVLLVTILNALGPGVTAAQVHDAVENVRTWRGRLAGFIPWYAVAAAVVLAAGLVVHAFRRRRVQVAKVFDDLRAREIERVVSELRAGKWERLPPNEAMMKLCEVQVRIDQELQRATADRSLTEGERASLRTFCEEQIEKIHGLLLNLDVERRMRVQLDPSMVDLPRPRTWVERVLCLLCSRAILAGTGQGRRLLYVATLALLVPALVSLSGTMAGKALDDRAVELSDLEVRLAEAEELAQVASAQEEAAKASQQAMELLGPPGPPLTPAQQQIITRVARVFEAHSAKSFVPDELARPAVFETQANAVRERILAVAEEASRPSAEAGPRLERPRTGSRDPRLSPEERFVQRAYEQSIGSHNDLSQFGRQVRAYLEDAVGRSPELTKKWEIDLRRLEESARPSSLRRQLMVNLMDATLGAANPDAGEFFRLLNDGLDWTSIERARLARANQLYPELVGGRPLSEVVERLSQSDPERPIIRRSDSALVQDKIQSVFRQFPDDNRLRDFAQQRPPSVEDIPERTANYSLASGQLAETAKRFAGREAAGSYFESRSDALNQYRDLFPGQLEAERTSHRGQQIDAFLGIIPEAPDHPAWPGPPDKPGGSSPGNTSPPWSGGLVVRDRTLPRGRRGLPVRGRNLPRARGGPAIRDRNHLRAQGGAAVRERALTPDDRRCPVVRQKCRHRSSQKPSWPRSRGRAVMRAYEALPEWAGS